VSREPQAGPHRRYDPLRDTWVLVSAGRSARPWKGQTEAPPREVIPPYDPTCQLCPGNTRATGIRNPEYEGTFVFTNDFPALRPLEAPAPAGLGEHRERGERVERAESGGRRGPDEDSRVRARREASDPGDVLLRAESEWGTARVLCFSPRHDLSLGSLPVGEIRHVVDLWADQTAELGEAYRWVQVFENKGEAMGASNPHPHGQLWAGTALPTEAAREDASQRAYRERTGRRLVEDVVREERGGPRVVVETDDWLAIVPFWAAWPFEILLAPVRPARRLTDLDDRARDGLAAALAELVQRFDGLFDRPFPYSMGWHQAPAGPAPGDVEHWQLHAHVYPPLLRADARKFMVGYELLAEPQRDLTPEDAAARLRAALD
jgi:UDPglucose--hexose-1-phosphate uridylyltransferase